MLRRTKRIVSNKTLLQEIMNARNDISQNRCEIQDLQDISNYYNWIMNNRKLNTKY